MAFQIIDSCINCGRCLKYCPVEAISIGDEIYEIDSEVCIECVGIYHKQQCAVVCPVDACIKLEN